MTVSTRKKASAPEPEGARDSEAQGAHWITTPYGMVAAAFGAGFILGGGLFTRITARLVNVALRAGMVAVLPQLQEAVLGAAQQAVGNGRGTQSTTSKVNRHEEGTRT